MVVGVVGVVRVVTGGSVVRIEFVKEKETKGAVRYEECGNAQIVGMLYIRKHALPDPFPKRVVVELSFEEV